MKEYRGKRVFVSGGAGVIGREMIPLLVANGAIVMVGDLEAIPEGFPKNIVYRRGDLNYITQNEINQFNPEIFIHLAATFERSTESYQHWEENFRHNVRLSNHLMTVVRNAKALKRVVFPSSYLIYDKNLYNFDVAQEAPFKLKETDPISPRNLTGMAKLSHEIELEFLRQFRNDDFTSVCARIYRGYGKNSRDVISRWVRDLLNGNKILIYRPEGIFDYMYAQDSAIGLLKLGLSSYEGVVNLGSGRSRRVSDVIDVLKSHFPEMKSENVESDIKIEASEADVTELKKAIEWLPERDLENTIPEIIEFEKARLTQTSRTKFHNVLVTSISKKVPLLKSLKQSLVKISNQIKIYGADLDNDCLGRYFTDDFWLMPRISDLSVNELIKYCDENEIGLIIPTRDGELEFFSQHKRTLKNAGISVMISEPEAVSNCLDKLKFSNFEAIQKDVIPAHLSIVDLNYDSYVVKERYGAGSLSIGIDLDKVQALQHAKTLDEPIFQPLRKGFEITIDSYVTDTGEVKGLVMRKRVKVVNGESQVTTTFQNKVLESTFQNFLASMDFYGHITTQAIIDDQQQVNIIECNPRIGGASMISIYAGMDTFYWAYLESIGENLENYPYFPCENSVTQVRHAHDYYL